MICSAFPVVLVHTVVAKSTRKNLYWHSCCISLMYVNYNARFVSACRIDMVSWLKKKILDQQVLPDFRFVVKYYLNALDLALFYFRESVAASFSWCV